MSEPQPYREPTFPEMPVVERPFRVPGPIRRLGIVLGILTGPPACLCLAAVTFHLDYVRDWIGSGGLALVFYVFIGMVFDPQLGPASLNVLKRAQRWVAWAWAPLFLPGWVIWSVVRYILRGDDP
jgi:hypothetical protein